MIYGVDISNNNYDYLSAVDFLPLKNKDHFVLMKASEGATYKDRYLDLYYNILHGSSDGRPDPHRLYGFYHYARPEYNNTPLLEAYNFLRLVGHHTGHALFVLDVEGAAFNLSKSRLDKWVSEWCQIIIDQTGVKPLIYCSESKTGWFKTAAAMDCGLWCAKWGKDKPKNIKPWEIWALWQHDTTQGNLDCDVFNGDISAWFKYCGQ